MQSPHCGAAWPEPGFLPCYFCGAYGHSTRRPDPEDDDRRAGPAASRALGRSAAAGFEAPGVNRASVGGLAGAPWHSLARRASRLAAWAPSSSAAAMHSLAALAAAWARAGMGGRLGTRRQAGWRGVLTQRRQSRVVGAPWRGAAVTFCRSISASISACRCWTSMLRRASFSAVRLRRRTVIKPTKPRSKPRMNQPIPLRPLESATIAVIIAVKSQWATAMTMIVVKPAARP